MEYVVPPDKNPTARKDFADAVENEIGVGFLCTYTSLRRVVSVWLRGKSFEYLFKSISSVFYLSAHL